MPVIIWQPLLHVSKDTDTFDLPIVYVKIFITVRVGVKSLFTPNSS